MIEGDSSCIRNEVLSDSEIAQKLVALEHYNSEIQNLLAPGSPTFTSLHLSFSRWLRQYKLSALYSPSYVINEAYLRGQSAVNKGIRIHNYVAWIRRTGFNVIRELYRIQLKFVSPDTEFVQPNNDEVIEEFNSDFDIDRELMRVKLAFQMLTPEDQEILNMKIVDGFSWEDIRREFNLRGLNLKTSTLRKRKERALIRLRDHYHRFTGLPPSG